MRFGGIQRTSTLDFPGVLACALFTQGCDIDCFYCHNRALIAGGSGSVDQAEVMAFLARRRGLLDGVVVSGGEPTLQSDLPEFLRRVRGMGYQTKLDTNGQRPAAVQALLAQGLLDYVALDLKAEAGQYSSVCGGSFEAARETLALLDASGVAFEVRTTLYPGLSLEGLRALLSALPRQARWRLNFFRLPELYRPQDAPRLALPALTPGQLAAHAEALRRIQPGLLWPD